MQKVRFMFLLRKYWWLPAILFIFLFSRMLFFPEPVPAKTVSVPVRVETGWDEMFFVPDNPAPLPFGIPREEMIRLAKNSSEETGVRSAFLIAILSQESSLGYDVGSCYLFDPRLFGGGIGMDLRSWSFSSRIMKPERDVEPFMKIMRGLSRDPWITRVSCPQEFGWGGAMGPLQIIPSTWMLVKDRTAKALNKTRVDPWVPEDAFMAAAIHLKDLGAAHQKAGSERTAACYYFSGRSCGKKKSDIAKYGDSVVKKAAYFQKMLNPKKAPNARKHKRSSKQTKKKSPK